MDVRSKVVVLSQSTPAETQANGTFAIHAAVSHFVLVRSVLAATPPTMRRSHTSAIVVLVLLAIVIISITTSCQARQSPRTIDDLARTPRTPARHDSSSSSQPQPQPRASRQLDPVIGTLDTDRELALVLVIHRHGDRYMVIQPSLGGSSC